MPGFFTFHELGGRQIKEISFSEHCKGTIGKISDIFNIAIWNDKDNLNDADDSINCKLSAVKTEDDTDSLFRGTRLNKFQSMLQARIVNAINIKSFHSEWKSINTNNYLDISPLTVNSARVIELRLNIPYDAEILDLCEFILRVIE